MGALDVSKGTVKSIYALGAKLGMVERRGGHEDALHALVQGLTGKESITALTPAEAQAVLAELRRRSSASTACASAGVNAVILSLPVRPCTSACSASSCPPLRSTIPSFAPRA